MKTLSRRNFLTSSASAAILASLGIKGGALAQSAKPRLTLISQWYHGGDAVAIGALGKYFESKGSLWLHTAVPGFTTDMMNKLRAQIISGDPPAVSQLKGPEIAAWSTLAPTVNLNNLVAEAKFAAAVAPDLAKQQMPNGDWIALPLQIHRGIRPECILEFAGVGIGQLPTTKISGRVVMSEATGTETIGVIDVADQRLLCRLDPELSTSPGAECTFSLDTRKVCLFDPTTEKLINSPQQDV